MNQVCQCGSHKAPPTKGDTPSSIAEMVALEATIALTAEPTEHSFKAFEARHQVEERKNELNLELYHLNVALRESAPDSQQEWEIEHKIEKLKNQLKAV